MASGQFLHADSVAVAGAAAPVLPCHRIEGEDGGRRWIGSSAVASSVTRQEICRAEQVCRFVAGVPREEVAGEVEGGCGSVQREGKW